MPGLTFKGGPHRETPFFATPRDTRLLAKKRQKEIFLSNFPLIQQS